MQRNMLVLMGLAFAVPVGGVLAQQPAEKSEPASRAAPRVRFRKVVPLPPGSESANVALREMNLQFEVENPTSKPIPYLGFVSDHPERSNPRTPISPLYQVQFQRETAWKPHPLGWCGTGLGAVQLEPGKKATFIITVPLDNWQAVKAGLSWYPTAARQDAQVAWSEAVPRKRVVTARSAKN